MTNKKFISFYSVLRFCPYRETDEFVNVGIILACPAVGFLDFKFERKRYGRVARFFPELNTDIFRDSVASLAHTLTRFRSDRELDQLEIDLDGKLVRRIFDGLVEPRETILFFSAPRVISTENPATCLEELFESYIERRFAQHEEYQETIMRKKLEEVLRTHNLLDQYERNAPVGDNRFRVRFPFVKFTAHHGHAERAIKALNLDKDEPTEIFRHADAWLSSVRRLRQYKTAPHDLLFVLKKPKNSSSQHSDAYQKVVSDFKSDQIEVSDGADDLKAIKFSQRH